MSRYSAAFTNPQGAGDGRPTALQIVEDEGLVGRLAGRTVFITGANQGIGLETARALHIAGATVFLGVRDLNRGQQAIDEILASPRSNKEAPLHLIEIRLDSLDSVRSAAKNLLAQCSKLNILILNAGVMTTPESKTKDGFETQFGTNHLGHFLLFQLLKPALLAAVTPEFNSRVVVLSSMGHRFGEVRFEDLNFEAPGSYEPWAAYGQSKTANIYMASEIEKRFGSEGLHALSVHPGSIPTNLSQYLDPSVMKGFMEDKSTSRFMSSIPQGAATSVYAALSKAWEGRGGRYLAQCCEQGPMKAGTLPMDMVDLGYAPWAFDGTKAEKLWKISCELVKIQDN
ncbi:WW domain-containing oxidoreductase [Seiridium cupressi]